MGEGPWSIARCAGGNAAFLYPVILKLVGTTHDSRAIPLLRQALSPPNYMIGIAAASGLAEAGDATSIPAIIARCDEAPAEAATVMALVYFDDAQAQNGVDIYIPKEEAKALREARAMGAGALHR